MYNKKLNELLEKFINSQDNTYKEEWWKTDYELAKTIITWFKSFLIKEGINLKE